MESSNTRFLVPCWPLVMPMLMMRYFEMRPLKLQCVTQCMYRVRARPAEGWPWNIQAWLASDDTRAGVMGWMDRSPRRTFTIG